MNFDSLDRYLLEGVGSKREVIASLLADRSAQPAAATLYRALEAVGPRVADEALIALSLILAGKTVDDEAIRHARDLVKTARSGGPGSQAARSEFVAELNRVAE